METTIKNHKLIFASKVEAEKDGLHIWIDDEYNFIRWESCSNLLANATDIQRQTIDVLPSGYGIHWPLLDEDLSVGGLLKKTENKSPY